jgi:hypothetical protein
MVQIRGRGKPIPVANPGFATKNGKNANDINVCRRMDPPPPAVFANLYRGVRGAKSSPQAVDSKGPMSAAADDLFLPVPAAAGHSVPTILIIRWVKLFTSNRQYV